MPTYELAACVAHFALPAQDHLAMVRAALSRAARVRVFVTRAWQAPSARLPFSFRERTAMLEAALESEAPRIEFEPVREHYDPQRTVRAVASGVGTESSNVLVSAPASLQVEAADWPSGWSFEPHEDPDRDTERRLASLYAVDEPMPALRQLEHELLPGTSAALRDGLVTPGFERLREEWRKIAHERKVWSVIPWPVTLVTVDALVRAGDHVLLIRRGRPPGQGLWALPGGFLENADTVLQSSLRELREETGLSLGPEDVRQTLRGVKVFDHPTRSQRGRIVAHAHYFDLGPGSPPPVQGGDDAAAAQWVPIGQLPGMETQFHDDHFHILDEFLGLTGDP